MPGKSKRETKNRGSKPAGSRRPSQERRGDTHKEVKVQAQTADTDSGSYQKTRPVPEPVSRSRARFPGEGRMRCAARS